METKPNEQIGFHTLETNGGVYNQGLTKREYYAGLAMQGLLSAVYSSKEMLNEFTKAEWSPGQHTGRTWLTGCEAVSKNAVSYADALIAELNKTKTDLPREGV